MSSNYVLYSSLSLIFTSHSVKMYYTCTRQLFTQPQHLMQLLQRFCKYLALVARLFGGGWDNQVSVITLLMQEGLNPAVSCALQHKRNQHPVLGFQPVTGLTGFSGTRLAGCFFELKDAVWC